MACYVEACQHEALYLDGTSCVCHLTVEEVQAVFGEEGMVEAVRLAALESDDFEVDSSGDIRLVERGNDGSEG